MGKTSKIIYFFITCIFFTFINFILSNMIAYKLSYGWEFSNSLFRITYAQNTGAAFSILQNSTNFLIGLSVLSIGLIFYYVFKNIDFLKAKGIFFASLLVAGILGNSYERIAFGYVRDFFDLNFINFPIFNISDIFINVGVIGIIILILFTRKNIKI